MQPTGTEQKLDGDDDPVDLFSDTEPLAGVRPRVVVVLDQHRGKSELPELVAQALPRPGRVPAAVTLHHACRRCGSEDHGRPLLLEGGIELAVGISISRCRGHVVVAVSDGCALGVDIESVDAVRFPGFDAVALHAAERPTLSARDRVVTWTRKEACLKALGVGLDVDPRLVRLSGPGEAPLVLASPPDVSHDVQLVDLDLPDGLVGCVATLSAARPEVTVTRGVPAAPSRTARTRRADAPRHRPGPRRTT